MPKQDKFSVALRNLMETQNKCKVMERELFASFDKEFEWLDEIYEAACSSFTGKSKRLEQMPKTPSVKNKMQKRRRKKEEIMQEIEEASTPKSSRTDTINLTSTDSPETTTTGRPMRRCRASKNVAKPAAAPKLRPKRLTKKTAEESSPGVKVMFSEPSKTPQDSGASSADKNEPQEAGGPSTPGERLGSNRKKKNTPQLSVNEHSEESSPSVKARAKAYEVMLTRLTPNSQCGSNATAAKSLSSPEVHADSGSKRKGSPEVSVSEHSPTTKKSKKSKQSLKVAEKEPTEDSHVPKQTRTRLRLNKQKQNEPSEVEAEAPQHSETKAKNTTPKSNSSSSHESPMDTSSADVLDRSSEAHASPKSPPMRQSLSETQVIISEVYEITASSHKPKLREYEVVKTKTTPVTKKSNVGRGDKVKTTNNILEDEDLPKNQVDDKTEVKSTRTRARAAKDNSSNKEQTQAVKEEENKDSGVGVRMSCEKANSTFTLTESESDSDKGTATRSTRTRARATQKEKAATADTAPTRSGVSGDGSDAAAEDVARSITKGGHPVQQKPATNTVSAGDAVSGSDVAAEEPVRSTRTRHRAQQEAAAAAKADEGLTKLSQKSAADQPKNSKRGKADSPATFAVHSSDEEIAGSPAMNLPRRSIRGTKRLVNHGRGMSPAPKRARSNMGADVLDGPPLSASSPIRNYDESESRDKVDSAAMAPRPYKFTSAQRNTSGFLNRTPGFSQNSSKLTSFINTPTSGYSSSSAMRSFLKKTSPSPQQNSHILLEQKKKKLLEKQRLADEKVNKAKEVKQQQQKEQASKREERLQKVLAHKQEQERKQRQREEEVKRKLDNTVSNHAKLHEERVREEAEKRRQRQRKQLEADLRRKQEDEERLRKRVEQEDEARLQLELFQKKRKQEELLRKQKIAEEKQKIEERLAEKEQREHEERARILQMQREKEMLVEKAKLEKENQLLHERMERERIEKEKRMERDKKLKEEMDRLKAMEQERLQQRAQEQQKQRDMAAKERELKQMISIHNKSVLTTCQQPAVVNSGPAAPKPAAAPTAVLNTTQTLNTSSSKSTSFNSYEMTPVTKTYVHKGFNANNYDLDDKNSDDSTDDDEAPKKKIPDWAMSVNLNIALIKQGTNPPDLEQIFHTLSIRPPDLEKIFVGTRNRRYKERTSSAIWSTPPMKFC